MRPDCVSCSLAQPQRNACHVVHGLFSKVEVVLHGVLRDDKVIDLAHVEFHTMAKDYPGRLYATFLYIFVVHDKAEKKTWLNTMPHDGGRAVRFRKPRDVFATQCTLLCNSAKTA